MERHRIGLLLALAGLLAMAPALVGAGDEGDPEEDVDDGPREPPPPLPWEAPKADEEECRTEEILVLRDLRGRSRSLDRREASLDERVAALEQLETEAQERLAELQDIRAEIVTMLEREQVATEDRVRALAKVVDTMKPAEAASMLAGMNRDVAILVLHKLKPKQAGKILGAMPGDIATELGNRMTVLPDPREATSSEPTEGEGP